ncbi:MAG TPA: hypothetical protein VLF20_05140 [Patescibacteria group bacterium]|nr:hypothetical protein [Patescibacteria group bacterium]
MAMTPEKPRTSGLTPTEQQARWYFGAARAYRRLNPTRSEKLFNYAIDLIQGRPQSNK